MFLLILLSMLWLPHSRAQSTAQQLYTEYQKQVYQIRVIDIASGDKSSIGSGFKVTQSGQIATNFHVVSPYIHEPEKYRLELIQNDGSVQSVALLSFDVVHDLAILQSEITGQAYFRFRQNPLAKGDRIYSMGNPQDLGMTIVEGNYNGLIETSRYQKILFSGSLNPGMSGGPAIDADGLIIGINVSKGGEQISFLVPGSELQSLMQNIENNGDYNDYKQVIADAIYADQNKFFQSMLDKEFGYDSFAELELPKKMSPSLKCWGHTADEKDIKYYSFHQHCKSEDVIFIEGDFYTGEFYYDYEWFETKQLNRFQLYHTLEERFEHPSLYNTSDKEHISEFICHTDFVDIDKSSWKVATCLREYKAYQGLFDAQLLMASVGMNDRAMLIKAGATGISDANALALFKRIMGSVKWKR